MGFGHVSGNSKQEAKHIFREQTKTKKKNRSRSSKGGQVLNGISLILSESIYLSILDSAIDLQLRANKRQNASLPREQKPKKKPQPLPERGASHQ